MNPTSSGSRSRLWTLVGLLFVWLGMWGAAAYAQTCAVPGWDGPAATLSGVINSYHAGSGSPVAGANSISVASVTGQRTNNRSLRAGDLILIMQMQDSTTAANAGRYEYAQIVNVSGTTLQLNRTLTNAYFRTMNTTNVRNWQVVYVPQYSSATITGTVTADRWDIVATGGSAGDATGGIVAFDVAGSLALNGTVSAAGAGFRGGGGVNGASNRAGGAFNDANYAYDLANPNGSVKGEGILGTPIVVFSSIGRVSYAALLNQGYAAGAGGQAAQGNAGGGGNDGQPAGGGGGGPNGANSGGGGGSNAGAGGNGGNSWSNNNAAGGRGAAAVANSVVRLVMGGGGGAGSTNNTALAGTVTVVRPATATVANGATDEISSSGANGGGVVLIRAGSISGSGTVDADGNNAYNKDVGSDSAGGGGAGGSIFLTAGSGTGAGMTVRARGGWGGRSNYAQHGPGGGGGGGYVLTNLASAVTSVIPGQNGQDACCGYAAAPVPNGAYGSTPGSAGTVITTGGTPTGVLSGAACLPVLNIGKTAVTPVISASTSATAVYSISARNTGGAATNLYLFDVALPPGWTYLSSPAPTYTYSPAPPPSASSNASGAETTTAVLPAGFPVNNATSVNSGAGVSLLASGAAPGVVPSNGDGTLSFGSFFLPQNGVITVSFVVSIPDTATVGTYHNAAAAAFLDPTRLNATRMVSPLTNVNANRNAITISNTTYASGSTTNVAGTNYSGLQGGPSADDVRLLADLSIAKTGPTIAGVNNTYTYTLVGRNNGRAIGTQTFSVTQATDVTTANVPATLGSNPIRVTDTFPTGVVLAAPLPTGTNWTCTGGVGSPTFSCGYFQATPANAYPLASGAFLPTITAVVRFSTPTFSETSCTTANNTATISLTPSESATSNNTSNVAASAISCHADLSVTKTNGTNTLVAGSTTQYTVTFSNAGPAAADGGIIRDTPSAGLSCTGNAVCTSNNGNLAVCPSGTVGAPNQNVSLALLTAGAAVPRLRQGGVLTFVASCGVTSTGLP